MIPISQGTSPTPSQTGTSERVGTGEASTSPYLNSENSRSERCALDQASLCKRKITYAAPTLCPAQTKKPLLESGISDWLTSDSQYAYMNSSPIKGCIPVYLNEEKDSVFAQIGNQKLISLQISEQSCSSADDVYYGELTDRAIHSVFGKFLSDHKEIKNIVDIGCYDADKSLLLQRQLKKIKADIIVFPVDIAPPKESHLPINIIPGQEITNADPTTTIFTVIYPYTGEHDYTEGENQSEQGEGQDECFITTIIKNNPGCFLFTSENNRRFSSPSRLIPAELVHTKIFNLNDFSLAKSKVLVENLHSLMGELMGELMENKAHYLSEIPKIKNQILKEKEAFEECKVEHFDKQQQHALNIAQNPQRIFARYVFQEIKARGVALTEAEVFKFITSGSDSWHVYILNQNLPAKSR